ncbi:MAG: beta-lactamase family protein [Lentisphaeria bacterium]|nr:beta-lactamase family protein [Lentisphaeria bacterium]
MNTDWQELRKTLRTILDDEIASGNECGCQLCIYHNGKPVINIAAGYTTPARVERVGIDSLFPLFSAGKTFLSALAWKLAERGHFSYDTPVAEFWKEFRTPDKSGITVEHLLSHRAGLYLLPSGQPDLTDWDAMCARIAAMPTRNLPGAKCHYHPLTFGWLVGRTLELASGISLPQLLKEHILVPAGVENSIFFGIDHRNSARVVPMDDTLMPVRPAWEAVKMNDPAIRNCCVPSFNGIGNAEGLAKFYSVLRGKLVSEKTFDYAAGKVFRDANDPIREHEWSVFGLGIILPGPPDDRRMFCGHGGAAGAEGFYMPDENVAIGFVKNRLSPRHPEHPVRDRISAALDIPNRFW